MRRPPPRIASLALALALLLPFALPADSGPDAPDGRAAVQARTEAQAQAQAPARIYLPMVKRGVVRHRELVGPDGALIRVEEGDIEAVELEIPPGALTEPTWITIEMGVDIEHPRSRPIGIPVRLGPSGLVLRRPARITLFYEPGLLPEGAGTDHVHVLHQPGQGGAPERLVPVIDLLALTVELDGFSTVQPHADAPTVTHPSTGQPYELGCPLPGYHRDVNLKVERACQVGAGSYVYRYLNVVDGGSLTFVDDGGRIDLRAMSILVEKGGALRAGSFDAPFGSRSEGSELSIGLWGADPTKEGARPPAPGEEGIACFAFDGDCYDPALTASAHYCTGADPADPCADAAAPEAGENARFEGYGTLNYDDNPFGYKVLAVAYGGELALFGDKGVKRDAGPGASLPPDERLDACPVPALSEESDPRAWSALSGYSWARLATGVEAGDTTLSLDHAVDWEPGDRVVISTTDWHPSHSETATIGQAGDASLELAEGLAFPHFGGPVSLAEEAEGTGNPNTELEAGAAVGLLSRDIVVRSLGATPDEDALPAPAGCGSAAGEIQDPGCYFGGHVIVRQGFRTAQLQGVELRQLGQGGRMGHYAVHFHLAKSTAYTNAFVKDGSIWDSMNRFVTIHGTHDVTLARNVGYLSNGHSYYLEDGSEIDNLLCQNLGVSAKGALKEYLGAQDPDSPTYRAIPPILDGSEEQPGGPYASDAIMPVTFWAMNQHNDVVGNHAAGVHGYGSCYWFLGSGLSGPSQSLSWTRATGTAYDYASINVAGVRQAPVKRFRGNSCSTATHALQTTTDIDPGSADASQIGFTALTNPYLAHEDIMRPRLSGNFMPVGAQPGTSEPNCSQSTPSEAVSEANWKTCRGTVIDRFTTAFNWARVDFGAVWLRPWWWLVVNSAISDQLSGGLGFVTGGSWSQVPPGNWQLAKDNLFLGTSRPAGPRRDFDDASGPAFDALDCIGPVCVSRSDGTGFYTGGLNPKRLITIYDGPFYGEGNVFARIPERTCDTTDETDCGIYKMTIQPRGASSTRMRIVDAAIGWKQPNGFYYPPAFAFRRSAFDDDASRHNVLDQYAPYLPSGELLTGISVIDASTILLDLDGSLTGMVVDAQTDTTTSSLSQNRFFDAPSQSPECASFGVQTTPYRTVTAVAAQLQGGPGGWAVDPGWGGGLPAVAIYRQLTLDEPPCAEVCDGAEVACARASFMTGAQNGQAPHLSTNHGMYYVDSSGQATTCGTSGQALNAVAFDVGRTYALYHLYATREIQQTFQVYVGPGFDPERDGFWFRLDPHADGQAMPVTEAEESYGSVSIDEDGLLTIEIDHATIATDYDLGSPKRSPSQRCMPGNLCRVDPGDANACVAQERAALAPEDRSLLDSGVLDAVCGFWATATMGVADAETNDAGVSLQDCPAGGCIGYAFTMKGEPKPYAEIGAQHAAPFPNDATWNVPLQRVDERCPEPEPPFGAEGAPGGTSE